MNSILEYKNYIAAIIIVMLCAEQDLKPSQMWLDNIILP